MRSGPTTHTQPSAHSPVSPKARPKTSWAERGQIRRPPTEAALTSAHCGFSSPARLGSLAPTPSLAPGRREKKGAHAGELLVPSTPTPLPSATHCCCLGGCWCTEPRHLSAARWRGRAGWGGRGCPQLGGTAKTQRQELKGQAERKGFAFRTPTAQTAQTQHTAVGSSPSSHTEPGPCLGSTLGQGRAQEPHSSRFPRHVASPILCRETEWRAQEDAEPGTATALLPALREPEGQALPVLTPGLRPSGLGNPEEASDSRCPVTKGPLGDPLPPKASLA